MDDAVVHTPLGTSPLPRLVRVGRQRARAYAHCGGVVPGDLREARVQFHGGRCQLFSGEQAGIQPPASRARGVPASCEEKIYSLPV